MSDALLQTQHAEHERLHRAGQLVPWVFYRPGSNGRGGAAEPIRSFKKAWAMVRTGAAGARGGWDLTSTGCTTTTSGADP